MWVGVAWVVVAWLVAAAVVPLTHTCTDADRTCWELIPRHCRWLTLVPGVEQGRRPGLLTERLSDNFDNIEEAYRLRSGSSVFNAQHQTVHHRIKTWIAVREVPSALIVNRKVA